MEEEQAKLERILDKKSESNVASPLEQLIVSLLKGFVDDADHKLQTLFKPLLYKVPLPCSTSLFAIDKRSDWCSIFADTI